MNKYDVYDLSVWYPFVPKPGWVDAVAADTLAVCIRINLDADDAIFRAAASGEPVFSSAKLILIAGDSATFRIFGDMFPSGMRDIDVPVYTGDDVVPDYSESWMIMRALPENMVMCNLELDPSCLVFVQKPPRVTLMTRTDVSLDETESTSEATVLGAVKDGHNVSVNMVGDALVFTAGAGLGRGPYAVPPYAEELVYMPTGGQRGLRSINGMTGAVNIAESPSISVRVSINGTDVRLVVERPATSNDQS